MDKLARMKDKMTPTGHRSQLEVLEAAGGEPSDDPARFVESDRDAVPKMCRKIAQRGALTYLEFLP
jgi:hypothetical protein